MTPLVVSDALRGMINSKVQYAYDHPFQLEDLEKIKRGELPPPGNLPEFTAHIPFGYKVVYTREFHLNNTEVKHISVSLDFPGRMPSQPAVVQILDLYGFKNGIGPDNYIYTEQIGPQMSALNVIEKVVP